MKIPTKEELRAEFARLSEEIKNNQAELQPHVDAYNAKSEQIEQMRDRELKPLEKKMIEVREGLDIFGKQQQLAMISRALGGETGQISE